jgi:hypothetical protein
MKTKTLIKGSEARRYEQKDGRYIGTRNGRFYLEEPEYNIEAMAHSLAQSVRFTGHSEWRYSVAEHSVLVSLLVEEMGGSVLEQMEGLLHDGTETVLADVASPVKAGLEDYKQLERRLDSKLRAQFFLPVTQTEIVTKADWLALFIEAAQLMPEYGQDFTDPNRLRPEALRLLARGWTPSRLDDDWRAARTMFLQRYTYLKELLSGKKPQAAKRSARQLAKDAQA